MLPEDLEDQMLRSLCGRVPPKLHHHHQQIRHATSSSSQYSGYDAAHAKIPSKYGWRYHLDNTFQFILWASFGSAAIHLINIKQKYAEKDRRLSTKIALLKDIIKRVGNGEDVNVAKELKVGKTEEERDWEEIMSSFREEAERAVGADGSDSKDKRTESIQQNLPEESRNPERQSGLVETQANKSGWFWR